MSHNIRTKWSGSYPCLCSGEWSLYIDGKNYSSVIPENLRSSEMDTFGAYEKWYFNKDWSEEWESYEDGLTVDQWIKKNIAWLRKLPLNSEQYHDVYTAFQANDFRMGSCGGCI